MAHLDHEQLWALARKELTSAQSVDAQAHLQTCDACQAQFSSVQQSVALLDLVPEAPPLPSLMAQRVGAKLNEQFDAQEVKSFTSWWRFSFSPMWLLGGLAAAAALIFAVLRAPSANVEPPIAKNDPIVVPGNTTVGTGDPKVVPVPAAQKTVATISSARKARNSNGGAAAAKQTVAAGDTLSTETGGQLWLKLTDGTKAGLTSASEVHVASLDEKAVRLEVTKGNLAMVVPHREDRLLTIQAGDLQVKDLGTRFLVSRDIGRVLVAVEEGSVEVSVPGQTRTLTAGHAVTWTNGEMKDALWAVTPPGGPVKTVAKTDDSNTPPIPVANPNANPDDEWAALPIPGTSPQPPPNEEQPQTNIPPPPDHVNTATPGKNPDGSENTLLDTLDGLERRLKAFGHGISLARLNGESEREWRARVIARMGDAGDCVDVLNSAARWVVEPPLQQPLENKLRRSVLTQQYRCLTRLGWARDAAQVEQQLRELQ